MSKILIVEDEVRLAETLRDLLELEHYAADISHDGESGLDNALSDIYDLVILDVMLPKKDGFSILRKLRQAGKTVPVLMLSARSELSDRVEGLDCGADYYLTKPFEPKELLDGAGMTDKPARWSGNIRSEAKQMSSLVEQMLTLARADNGVRPAAMEPVNLSDVATDCALAFEPVAFEAGKPLEDHIAEEVAVTGDADRLRRLISILVDNAVKYGAEGGTITLTLEKTDRQARLTVANPGEPIPPENLAHLFERFYRADTSRGEKTGFGLGLSIADTIAREHKGTLKAESDAASTRFIFTMPLKK